MPDNLNDRLSRLPAASRARVEKAFKDSLERELAVVGPETAGANFDKQHDRGPLFGKDFDKQSSDLDAMRHITELDEAAFARFKDRLSVLKSIQPGP